MKKIHDQFYVAGQISLDDMANFAEAGIKTIINNRPDNEEPGQLSAEQSSAAAKALGIEYHHLPMANGQALPDELVAQFKAVLDSSDGPVLAHCRSGMRSSFLWALGQIPTGAISVDQAIEAAQAVGIPLGNARDALASVQP